MHFWTQMKIEKAEPLRFSGPVPKPLSAGSMTERKVLKVSLIL